MSDNDLEEVCTGHLFLANNQDADERKKFAVDGKMLGILNCDFCIADERNKQCYSYRPIRPHIYNVLPAENPK